MSKGEEEKVEGQAEVSAEAQAPSVLEAAISATKQTERSRAEELLIHAPNKESLWKSSKPALPGYGYTC